MPDGVRGAGRECVSCAGAWPGDSVVWAQPCVCEIPKGWWVGAKNRRLLKTSIGVPISEQKYWAGGRASGAGDPILFQIFTSSVFAQIYVCDIAVSICSSMQEYFYRAISPSPVPTKVSALVLSFVNLQPFGVASFFPGIPLDVCRALSPPGPATAAFGTQRLVWSFKLM